MSHELAATSQDQEPHLHHYELLQTIGEGNHAKVKLGQHLPTRTQVAIKIIQKDGLGIQQRPILQEARCMAGLRHPNIVQLFQVINTKELLFIIMEHVTGGDMKDYLLTHGRMTEGEARGSFRQLVSAVHYCHEKGIIHRDLKPQNVLFDTEMNVKLTDFGISTPFSGNKLSTFCGSPAYAAPEVLREEEYDGPPVDIWSLGVLLYKMVTGTVPFKGKNLIELVEQILKGTYTLPFYLTAELHTLLRKLITLNPRDRSTLKEIMPDPWLNMDHVEELTPFVQPPSDELDPNVTQEMIDMGFKQHQIQKALTKKTYNNVMATYLILNTKKSRVRYHTIRVSPYRATDLNGLSSSPDQEAQTESSPCPPAKQQPKEQESGQEAEESAGPSASPDPRNAAPGPSPKSRKVILQPSLKWKKVTPRHSPQSIAILRPTPKSRTATLRTNQKSSPATPSPTQKSGSKTTTPRPMKKESTTTTPPPMQAESTTSTRPPMPEELTTITRPPMPEESTTTTRPPMQAESTTSTRPPMPEESTTTTRPPMPEESTTITPPPNRELESKTITPPTMQESESKTITPPRTPESKNATSSPPTKCGPGDSASTHNTSPRRSSSSNGGSPEESQGRSGVARRCLGFLRKLCLRPFKKGLDKQQQSQARLVCGRPRQGYN